MSETNEVCVVCGQARHEGRVCCKAQAYALGSRYALCEYYPPEWEGMPREFKDEFERGVQAVRREYWECYGVEPWEYPLP